MKRPLATMVGDGLPHEPPDSSLDSPGVPQSFPNDIADDIPPAKRSRLTTQAVADATEPYISSDPHKDTGEDAVSNPNSDTVLPSLQGEHTNGNHKKFSLLGIPKDMRLHIYEYLIPRPGLIPSTREETDIDRLVEYGERPAGASIYFSLDNLPHALLRKSYSQGSEPAILRVNRQTNDEFADFMRKKLTFQVDILTEHMWEEKEWCLNGYAKLQICSKDSKDRELLDLNSEVKFVRKIALRVWIPRKFALAPGNSGESSVSGSAKCIKQHLNRLVVALMQSPCLKSVDVQFSFRRRQNERAAYSIPLNLDPPIIDDTEMTDMVAWYTQPFRLLRGIDLDFRYIGEVYGTDSTISDTLAANTQRIFDAVKQEVSGNTPVTVRTPLCALYDAFVLTDVFERLSYHREREPESRLPLILETLWQAHDTGDRDTFSKMVREVYAIYEVITEMTKKEFGVFLEME